MGRSHDTDLPPSTWPKPNRRAPTLVRTSPDPHSPWRFGGWVLAQVATAAMLLLTLAVGYAAVRQRAPEARDEARWVPALVRALASAPAGVVDVPLVEMTFRAEELPAGEKEVIYYQLTIPPSDSLPALAGSFCVCPAQTVLAGVGAEVVQVGRYSLRLDAPLRVQRAGSAHAGEEIPAGTEVTLAAGDAVIYPNYAAQGEIRNAGDEPVVLVGVAIVPAEGSGTPVPPLPTGVRATLLTQALAADWQVLPRGPVNVALHQVTLPPGTHIGPYAPMGLEAMRIDSGTIARSFLRSGESTPRGQPSTHLAGATVPFTAARGGVRQIVASTGDEPAVLLALIIEPAAITTTTLAP